MKYLLFTKFSHWQYEQEYRAYVNLDEKETNGLYFMDFSDKLKLRCVIVGEQSSVTRADVVGALEGIETGITVFKARAGFRAFEVVSEQKRIDVVLNHVCNPQPSPPPPSFLVRKPESIDCFRIQRPEIWCSVD